MRFDLWQSERERAEVQPNGVRVLSGDNPPTVKIWPPKATKPSANFRFRSPEQRDLYIAKYMANFSSHKESVASRRQARRGSDADRAQLKVGAIFVYSWGYDQTNVDYWQITEVRGSTVVARKIKQRLERATGPMSANGMPVPGEFIENEPSLTKRVQFYNGEPSLSMDYSTARLWRGESSYCSWYH